VKKTTKRELAVVAPMISRMIGTPVLSGRTEYSVTTVSIPPAVVRLDCSTPFENRALEWFPEDS
jgi:hypothetical protein